MTPIAFGTVHLLNPEQPTASNPARPTLVWEAGNGRCVLTFADRADALAHLTAAMEAVHALTPAADEFEVVP